ncbi:hypothetical protein A8950_2232 [Dongia mobilis]|uniref:Uncharacterized protein n=1 Tax=Dongia mobilis TaxID=578943 RepID=A0A4R6WMZ7_9PROT|nr:hypothetical protein [Dongia mobilis]TDQ82409.1 hypothetical protein A8950_2232 [Dongia mobilis]
MVKEVGTAMHLDIEAERARRLRQRNWALAGALVLFVVLVFIVSIVKMGGN